VFRKIDHVEIITANFERSDKFYTDILGFALTWRVKPQDSKWDEIVFVELGGSQIVLISQESCIFRWLSTRWVAEALSAS